MTKIPTEICDALVRLSKNGASVDDKDNGDRNPPPYAAVGRLTQRLSDGSMLAFMQ